jgi:hypothetical protein
MLTILGNSQLFCDGVSRRNFLRIGALGMGAFSLPSLMRLDALAGNGASNKSVIMVYLPGGASHLDMYDIKENAPSEIRGEFRAIPTNVPGIRVCEHMPRLAANMDKFVPIRALVGQVDQHSPFQTMTGRVEQNQPPGGWPSVGATLSRFLGSHEGVPAFIALSGRTAQSGYAGAAHGSFEPSGPGKNDMVLNGVTLDRLENRKSLLTAFDKFRRDADASKMMEGFDGFNQKAFDVITSSRLVKALDLKNEDPNVVARYNMPAQGRRGLENFLIARRLVEAGARCVTLNFGGWDTHSQNFVTLRTQLPQLDHGVTTLVEELHERGLAKDVSVVVWGEFGRTPRVNGTAGRDHWSRVGSALLAGGGMKTGQVLGQTDRGGGEAADRPVNVGEVLATLYHNCGLRPNEQTLPDFAGRPHYLVDKHAPISELV